MFQFLERGVGHVTCDGLYCNYGGLLKTSTAQKMKFSIKDCFSKCDQIRSFLRIWSHLLKKSIMENFIFCEMKAILVSHFIYPMAILLWHNSQLKWSFIYDVQKSKKFGPRFPSYPQPSNFSLTLLLDVFNWPPYPLPLLFPMKMIFQDFLKNFNNEVNILMQQLFSFSFANPNNIYNSHKYTKLLYLVFLSELKINYKENPER